MTKISKTDQDKYELALTVGSRKFQSTGSTFEEALRNLKPLNPKGRCMLYVKKGNTEKHRVLTQFLVNRLFTASNFTKEVAIKNLTMLYQGI